MVNIAILGYGTVGSGVYDILDTNGEGIARKVGKQISVAHVLDLRDFDTHPRKEIFTKDFDVILNDASVSVVVETIGGVEPAYTFTKKALLAGKSVVTSNKELVAKCGTELLAIAKEKNVNYLFEASVGGGIPIIRPLHKCLAANNVTEIFGILNGTTNYILTQMIHNNKSFEEALAEAQEKGYAERNPAADVEGHDACRKISILASLAFGNAVDSEQVYTEGITKITLEDVKLAGRLGYVIKLIGYTRNKDGKTLCRVSPMLIKKGTPLAMVEDVFNAIMVRGDSVGDVMFYGRGAGKLPTASAVLGDVIDIVSSGENKNFIWTAGDGAFMQSHLEADGELFVRADGVSVDEIRALFGADTVFADSDEEVCFIAPAASEAHMMEKIEKLGSSVKSYIRVMK